MDSNHHHPSLDCLFSRGSLQREAKELTEAERKAHEVLSQVPGRTIFGSYIKRVIKRDRASDFRKLISELKDQLRDAPKALESAIGKKGLEAIKNIS